ncbi:SMI1/KNR4 family protein [Mucilaginibacter terrae]|uniref:Knr4/Smi1-like domain-containing protein n=1 Tax=Mucilaginibacter terrae TaxID=1955052 RepID=A0ABU3GYF4_9SPHI|nr:SMI1/KNR4 family protein [Mucilaginibacter terrae]MDT3404808.1 hypothetical protein [Mucilaginibacter terrae]
MNQILNKHNWPRRQSPTTSIDDIESLVGFKLPDDYKSFLLHHSGYEGFIGQEFLRLWDADEIVINNNEYGITQQLSHTLGIGSNGASEFIALVKYDDGFDVVLSPLIDLDEEYHITIGSSFTNFLERLDAGENWFDQR